MQAHRVTARVSEDGVITIHGTPFQSGEAVEVIVLPASTAPMVPTFPLRGIPITLIDPFEPAAPPEDWEALK